MEYTKHPLESLKPEELEKVAAYEHQFTDENVKNISMRFQEKINTPKSNKRPVKKLTVLLASAAVVVLALSGFANFDRIQQLFNEYFGSDINISQYAQVIDKSCTDQGIRLDVLTALHDGDNTYLFVDLKDETGNRLSDDMFIDNWYMRGGRDIGGGNCRLMHYNPDTGVATLAVHAIGGIPGKEAVFSLNSFFTGEVEVELTDETIQLSELLAEHEGQFVKQDFSQGRAGGYSQEFINAGIDFDEITDGLEVNAIHVTIPGYDRGYISNIGYRDGYLHVQMNPDNEKGNEMAYLSLVNRQTGEELSTFYTIQSGLNTGDDGDIISGDCEESVFKIDRADLDNYSLHLNALYFNNVITGDWEVSFEVPAPMTTVPVSADKTIVLGNKKCTVKELTVSPLSVAMVFEVGIMASGDVMRDGDITVTLIYQDGSSVLLVNGISMYMEDDDDNSLVVNGPIMNFENLAALEINGVEFKLPNS